MDSRPTPHGLCGLLVAAVLGAATPASADPPSFEDFYRDVSQCRLDMARYGHLIEARHGAVLISLPSAGAIRGLLFSAFYFAPAGAEGAHRYGLLINAPLEAVTRTFPEFAARQTINGHLRRLARLSEESGQTGAQRKTLLTCTAGTAV